MEISASAALVAPPYFNFATEVMDPWARVQPDATALWCVNVQSGSEQRFSFQEMTRLSRQAAGYFRSLGLKKGDRVLIMLPRVWQWWVGLLGLIRLGAVPVPATLLLTTREVAYRLETGRVHAVLTSHDGLAKLDGFDGLRMVLGEAPAGCSDFDTGVNQADGRFDSEPIRSDDPGILYFTSATTGEPKMVLHTQASYGLGHQLTGRWWLDLKPGEVHWNISDLGWGKAGWSSFFGPWQMGACVFALDTHGKFDAATTLRTLEAFPITTWCAPPTALRLIVRQDLGRFHSQTLRHCVTAGEPLNPEVLRLWKEATGLTLHEAYGQTETVVLIGNFRALGREVRPGSMGQPTPGFEVALLDDDLRELPPGREGEVAVRIHPRRPVGLFREYWLSPEETARQLRAPWYLTGDRALRDPDGYYWFIGRKDDVIKSSGYRIGPFEVESALIEHPAVVECAVTAAPDELRGVVVKATCVLAKGWEPSDALVKELQDHVKHTTAPYKYPRIIEFVAELPKTISGKIKRAQIREESGVRE